MVHHKKNSNKAQEFRVGLVAHDEKKSKMIKWCQENSNFLKNSILYATGTTGELIKKNCPSLSLTCLKSGPLGGDQQIGALIADNKINILVFFMDPLSPHPHDVDIKALLRLATLYNIPCACNISTADLIIQAYNN